MAKKKILIVDDDAVLTRLLKTVLERSERYEVYGVNKGALALDAIKSFGPDLVLLDIDLPDVNGREICLTLNKDEILKKTPVIFLTGAVSSGDMQKGIDILGRPAMCKPIHMEKLIEFIEKNLTSKA